MSEERKHHLELRFEEAGYRHYLQGQPVHAGDLVELFTEKTGWISGRYEWSYQPEELPSVFYDEEKGFVVQAGDQLRWPNF